MLEIAVLYGCDLSQVFTPIILRLYQPHSLCEKGATRAAAKAALYVFLLPPLREGRLCTDTGDIFYDTDFYSRPYTRGDGAVRSPCRDEAYFYSRPYTRGDLPIEGLVESANEFLLAPLREGRPVWHG